MEMGVVFENVDTVRNRVRLRGCAKDAYIGNSNARSCFEWRGSVPNDPL